MGKVIYVKCYWLKHFVALKFMVRKFVIFFIKHII